jgi:hypothetical protein
MGSLSAENQPVQICVFVNLYFIIMELKKFRNKYDLELIPASHDNIINGKLVWDPLIGAPKFDHPGMPNHIFNAFVDAELIQKEELEGFLSQCRDLPLGEAKLAERSIEVDMDMASTLDNPRLGKLEHEIGINSIKRFTFGELKTRCLDDLMRVTIDDFLEEMKENKWELYDGKIRRVFMITELYYGSISLVIDKEFRHKLEASLPNIGMDLKHSLELEKSVQYTFEHQNVPFAMRIEKVRNFNG